MPTARPSYCSSECNTYVNESGCDCVVLDQYDLVYPETEEYSIFIGTRLAVALGQQLSAHCNGSVCAHPWTEENRTVKRIVYPDVFNLAIQHQGFAPVFYADEVRSLGYYPESSKWQKQSSELWGQVVSLNGTRLSNSRPGANDIVTVRTLIDAARVDFESVNDQGAVFRIVILYGDCRDMVPNPSDIEKSECSESVQRNGALNYYQYQVIMVPRSDFFVPRAIYSLDQTVRSIRNMTGLRFIFQISGRPSRFAFNRLLQSIVTMYIFLSVAAFLVDFIVLYMLPGRRLYSEAKYEHTENFTELRNTVMNENNSKKRIEMLTKMARFQTFREVEDLLDGIKNTVTAVEYDQLVLTCVEVYGGELKDMASATSLSRRFNSDSAKIKGHVMLGQLKEAYVIAVKTGDRADIEAILREAERAGNNRVEQLCRKYLSDLDK
jgi:hypothetical protein